MDTEKHKTKKGFLRDKRLRLVNWTLVVGVLALASVSSNTNQTKEAALTMGWILIFGSSVLRSAKKTSLGLTTHSIYKKSLEVIGLIFSFLFLLFYSKANFDNLANHPLPLAGFVWILTYYLVTVYQSFFGEDKRKKIILVSACFILLFFVTFYVLYALLAV